VSDQPPVIPVREYEPGYDPEREMQDWMNELQARQRRQEQRRQIQERGRQEAN